MCNMVRFMTDFAPLTIEIFTTFCMNVIRNKHTTLEPPGRHSRLRAENGRSHSTEICGNSLAH